MVWSHADLLLRGGTYHPSDLYVKGDLTVEGAISGDTLAAGSWEDVRAHGAVGDVRRVTDAVTTAASATLTSATAAFTSADVGKLILLNGGGATRNSSADGAMTSGARQLTATGTFTDADVGRWVKVPGAGAAGADLISEIAFVQSATVVRLVDAASTTVSTKTVQIVAPLATTIAGVTNSTTATLGTTATTSLSGVIAHLGTDDTTALQTAFTAGAGGLVLAPAGTYFTARLDLAAYTHLLGAGMGATIFKLKAAQNTDTLRGQNATGVQLRDLTVDGSRAHQTAVQAAGVYLSGCADALVERVEARLTYDVGIALANCDDARVVRCRACRTRREGIWLGTGSERAQAEFCTTYETGIDGISLQADDTAAIGCVARSAPPVYGGIYGGPGFYRLRIQDNHVSDVGVSGIDLGPSSTDDSYGCIISGNTCDSNRNAGIFTASNGTVVQGNTCRNNGQTLGGSAPDHPYGIVYDGANMLITSNHCTDTQGSPTQTHGIASLNDTTITNKATIALNDLRGNGTAALNVTHGTDNKLFGNRGAEAWTSFTPVIDQGGGAPTFTVNNARYRIVDSVCHFQVNLSMTAAGTVVGNNPILLSGWPTQVNSVRSGSGYVVGDAYVIDASTAGYLGFVENNAASQVRFYAATTTNQQRVGQTPNFALAIADEIHASWRWEIA